MRQEESMMYDNNPKTKIEQAISALRAEQPDTETMKAAGDRVWQHLQEQGAGVSMNRVFETIRGCEDVSALLPQYHEGSLSAARSLLVEDHLHECAGCRIAAEQGKRSNAAVRPWTQALPTAISGLWGWRQYALAAMILAVAGVSILVVRRQFFAAPQGIRARIESVNGAVYRVASYGERPALAGEEFAEGERIRTPNGSTAMVRLRDGSMVEMNQRAEISVSMTRKDTTIHLQRGNIIVQAAKRRTGHLYVASKDCMVSVTGTVFAVNSGVKGSRVSVIEGEVRVAQSGVTDILHSGDQVSTNASVESVPVPDEIAWSQNLDKHLALLAEFQKLENKIEQIPTPGLRYESRLLPLLPAGTVVYASIPNLGQAMSQANQLFQQQLQESAVLREWWQQSNGGQGHPSFQETIEKIHMLSRYLGDEIVLSAQLGASHGSPLILALPSRPGLKEFINSQLASQNEDANGPHWHALEEKELAAAGAQSKHELFVLVLPNLVAAGDLGTLRRFDAQLRQGQGSFASTAFGQRMAEAYRGGAGLLFGADLSQITQHASYGRANDRLALERSGFADLRYLIAERKNISGQTSNNAELTFNGPRHGIASWLAAPAPMGGLDFVSADAAAVASFVVKNPAQMLDDLLEVASASNPKSEQDFAQLESELRFKLRDDLASTLGGEATFALDGPILPTPAWKVIIEVNDSNRLQYTLQQLVQDINQKAAERGEQGLSLEQEQVDGRTYYAVRTLAAKIPVEISYTFADGYIIIAPSRAFVMNAIRTHQNADGITRSAEFKSLLPQDQHANVSALLYQNLAPVIGPIAQQLSPSQLQSLQVLSAETKPSVVCAYGGDNSIEVASNSRFFGLDLNTFALSTLLGYAERGTNRRARP
jgi:ferric-dicitrate binding protein FerR (iron transport regulator)